MPTAIWVHKNDDGVVDAASVAEYTDAALLREWRRNGWTPEMYSFPDGTYCTVGAKLPSNISKIQ